MLNVDVVVLKRNEIETIAFDEAIRNVLKQETIYGGGVREKVWTPLFRVDHRVKVDSIERIEKHVCGTTIRIVALIAHDLTIIGIDLN